MALFSQNLALEYGVRDLVQLDKQDTTFSGYCAISSNPVHVRVIPRESVHETALRAVGALRHSALAPVQRVVLDEEFAVILSDFVPGWQLHQALEWGGVLNLPARLTVLRDVTKVLAALVGALEMDPDISVSRIRIGYNGRVLVQDPARDLATRQPSIPADGFPGLVFDLDLHGWLLEHGIAAGQSYGSIARFLSRTGFCGPIRTAGRPVHGGRRAVREARLTAYASSFP